METTLERRPWLVPAILAVLAILLFRPALIPPHPGEVLDGKDLPAMFYPLQETIRQAWHDGELPLWNPRQFIGHPLIGNAHSALFYPFSWFVWLVGVQRGIGIVLAVHAWLAAWGMARLVRRLGSSYSGSLLAGIVYAMSGWAGAHYYAGHYNLMLVFAWIPWVMTAYYDALQRATLWATLPGMAFLALALLAGYPPLLIYLGMALLVLGAVYAGQAPDLWPAARDAALRLLLIGIGGLCLAGAIVVPAAELARHSARDPNSLAFANTYALPPAHFLTAAVPGLFGTPKQKPADYWGTGHYEEYGFYAGLLPLIAVPLALRWCRREKWYFIGLIGLGVALSVGLEGALMPLLVRWVPGFGLFRVPARATILVVMGMAGLTALLITNLEAATAEERRDALEPALRRWLPAGIVLVLALALLLGGLYANTDPAESPGERLFTASGALAETGVIALGVWFVLWVWTRPDPGALRWALALTLLLVTLDAWQVVIPTLTVSQVNEATLWQGAQRYIPTGPDARVLRSASSTVPVNGASVTGHLHVLGYDPLVILSYNRLQKVDDHQASDPSTRINTLLGVRYFISDRPYLNRNFTLLGIYGLYFYYERSDPFPRIWYAQEIAVEKNDKRALVRMTAKETDLGRTVFVDRAVECPGTGGESAITAYHRNDLTIETHGAGGLLVLSDQYYPGWRAMIDGKRVPIVRADTALRAVCVPPGDHTVRYVYRPLSLIAGVLLSVLAWPVWIVLCVRVRRRGRFQPAAPGRPLQ